MFHVCLSQISTILNRYGRKLKPIEKFVTGQNARSGFKGNVKRFINHKMETGQIRDYTEKLTQALAEFGVSVWISSETVALVYLFYPTRSYGPTSTYKMESLKLTGNLKI
jgi:hypothetical protein